jgi:hypothetical protein
MSDWWKPKVSRQDIRLLPLLFVMLLVRGLAQGSIKLRDLWPSPHTWNQIMFGSVLVLVLLGIVALVIFIGRCVLRK